MATENTETHASVEIVKAKPESLTTATTPESESEPERIYPMYPLKRMMAPGTGAILSPTKDSVFYANKRERLSYMDRGLAADAKGAPAKGEIETEGEEEGEDTTTKKTTSRRRSRTTEK